MSDKAVLYERNGAIGVITLNRPDKRNSMNPELLDAFAVCSETARNDSEIRCVIITGTGNCFSAGADLRASLQRSDPSRLPHEASYAMYAPFLSVLDIEVPVVAALNGHAVGGGFGLALLADVRIANANAKFGANFARLGLHSGLAISYVLPRMIGVSRASELLFTGRLVKGDEAASIGLVSEAVEADAVLNRANEIASQIAAAAPIAVRTMKASIRRGLDWRIREAAMAEAHLQAASLQTSDAKEGMAALLEKREPAFRGE